METNQKKHKFTAPFDDEQYSVRKRLPRTFPKRKSDVYITSSSNVNAQIRRCRSLLEESGFDEVFVHGLGNAINRAINVALQLKVNSVSPLEISAHTSTVELIDDLEPKTEEAEPGVRSRNNSAIHIRVYRVDPVFVGDTNTTSNNSNTS